MYKPTFDQ